MSKKIKRRCKCGCGGITSPGKMWIKGHQRHGVKLSAKTKEKMSEAKQNMSDKTKEKMSKAKKGKKQSGKHILNKVLAKIKNNPNYEYCQIWLDKDYKNDIRKDYCENLNCKNNYRRLCNHHIYLDKKKCAPNDIMTLCNSCHMVLHHLLQKGYGMSADPQNFIIINRVDHVSYIHKQSKGIIKIAKQGEDR